MKHVPPPEGEPVDLNEMAERLINQAKQRQRATKRVRKMQERARNEIERLIAFLDACDPYVSTELEDQVDDGPVDDTELEPSLCGVTVGAGTADDRELDNSDDEPSLGSLDGNSDQTTWADGNRRDLEPSLAGGGWSRFHHDGEENEAPAC